MNPCSAQIRPSETEDGPCSQPTRTAQSQHAPGHKTLDCLARSPLSGAPDRATDVGLLVDRTSLEGSKRRISGVSMAQRLRASLASTPRLKDPGDSPEAQAVSNLLEGRIDQAVEQLEALAKAQPDTYSVAANLGTAYELKGELALAHTWITRAMELNPQSHQGTEWLHLAWKARWP